MDASLFDFDSWKRAAAPAFRTFSYMTMLYVVIAITLLVPNYIFLSAGVDLSQIFGWLSAIAFVLAFFLAFFKVLDEMRPGDVQLQLV